MTNSKPTIDGKLDEAIWTDGWQPITHQRRLVRRVDITDRAEYVLATDGANLYFAFRAHCSDMEKAKARSAGSMWGCDTAELFFSPSGLSDDFYQFSVDYQGKRSFTQYWGEGGNIAPDPFAPDWRYAIADTEDGWCVEAAIPFSALYMTRNKDWKGTWLVNVGFSNTTKGEVTMSSLADRFLDSKHYNKLGGFPARSVKDDFSATEVSATFDTMDEKGRIAGTLTMNVYAGEAGDYVLASRTADIERKVALKAGNNIVKAPCHYAQAGRLPTDLAFTRAAGGKVFRRTYPVSVEYEPIRVTFTKPGYRNNFYPGQDVREVVGSVKVSTPNQTIKLTLEGPGFAKQTVVPAADGTFRFDTTGFAKGEAWLMVATEKEAKKIRIRNLPETGRWMSWVEDKRLVVNGRPGFRRGLYAPGYCGGTALKEKYRSDCYFSRREFNTFIGCEPRRLIKGSEAREGVRDVRPCEEMFRKVDEILAACKDKDFTGYYLCDEPECRNVSSIYLRHLYEYIAEKDPYHVVSIASRNAVDFYKACDLVESHDYINVFTDENGKRDCLRPPAMIADHLASHAAAQPNDKVLGCYSTAFTAHWQSFRNEYPTFDEYLASTFAGIVNGAKYVQAYAYHDFADRPSVYHGYRYVNSTIAALEDLLLTEGKTLLRTPNAQCVRFAAGGEDCFILVNFTWQPQTVTVPGLSGRYYEFRGSRTFDFSSQPSRFDLRPMEVLIATSRQRGLGLPSGEAIVAQIDREEAERMGRDNQLLWRPEDITFESAGKMLPRKTWKLIDGTRDVIGTGWTGGTNYCLALAFKNDLKPSFDKVRVYGFGIDGLQVDVKKGGEWVALDPVGRKTANYFCELAFAEAVQPLRMRLRFTHPKRGKNPTELYEIELPAPTVTKAKTTTEPKRPRAAVAAAPVDEKPLWKMENLSLKTNAWSKTVSFDAEHPWLVMEASFKAADAKRYNAWVLGTGKGGFGGAVRRYVDGLYTLRVPPAARKRETLKFWLYNVKAEIPLLETVATPANLLSASVVSGGVVRAGAVIRVRLDLAAPCEDVVASFVRCGGKTALGPVNVNGRSNIEMKALDETGRHWGADIPVAKCEAAKSREVFVLANVLGGALEKPILTNFIETFENP